MRIPAFVSILLAGAVALAGCDIPRDNEGTLDRVRGSELRVGVTDNRPWVRIEGEAVQGLEPELLRLWAERLGARIRWVRGDLDALVHALEAGRIDVLAAGLTSDTPYRSRLGVSQTYYKGVEQVAARGKPAGEPTRRRRIMAAAPGESALLLALDRFLLGLGEARIAEILVRESAR
jgi:polar amino acid transport system substrate-binding protein